VGVLGSGDAATVVSPPGQLKIPDGQWYDADGRDRRPLSRSHRSSLRAWHGTRTPEARALRYRLTPRRDLVPEARV
jgi:hypothetical protein